MSRTQSTNPQIVTLTIYIIGVADDQEARGSTIEDLKLRREEGKGRSQSIYLRTCYRSGFTLPLSDGPQLPDLTTMLVTVYTKLPDQEQDSISELRAIITSQISHRPCGLNNNPKALYMVYKTPMAPLIYQKRYLKEFIKTTIIYKDGYSIYRR